MIRFVNRHLVQAAVSARLLISSRLNYEMKQVQLHFIRARG